MIKVIDLCKEYKSNEHVTCSALKNINFTLPEKGMVFICGKSGSGKSTLLNILGGLDNLTSGDVVVDGISMSKFRSADFDNYRNNDIGFIFQDFCLMDTFTIYENIKFSLDLQQKEDEQLILNTLKMVDLEGLGNRYPKELSGGQKQRVAIARALIKKPKMILADEPTGNLDSVTSKVVLEKLKEISKNNLVLIISHNYDDAQLYADRIIELSDGQIVSDTERIENSEFKLIDKNTINIPLHKSLTKKELTLINKKIKDGKTKIKQADSEFAQTVQPAYNPTFKKPKRAKGLKAKGSVELTKKLTKGYRITLCVTAFLTALLIIILGFSQIFTLFDGSDLINKAVNSQSNSSFVLHKGYSNGEKYKTILTSFLSTVEENDIETFRANGYNGNIYKLYNHPLPIKSAWDSNLEYNYHIDDKKNFANLYAIHGYGVLSCDESYLARIYGTNGQLEYLATATTKKPGGIVIPDYFADALLHYAPATLTNDYQKIVDRSTMWNNTYTVNAIFKTKYKERYKEIIDGFNSAQLIETLAERKKALKDITKTNIYQTFTNEVCNFLAVGFYLENDNYVDSMTTNYLNAQLRTRLTGAEIFDETGKLLQENSKTYFTPMYGNTTNKVEVTGNNIFVGANIYNSLFGTNVTYAKQENFVPRTITIRNYAANRNDTDLPTYTLTLNIVGLTTANDFGYVCSDETYAKIKSFALIPYALYFENGESAANMKSTISLLNYYSENQYFKALYTIMNIVDIFGDFFMLIAIALSVACALMLINFGRRCVRRRMHEIGIIRALGGRTKHISRSFILQVFYAGIITCTLSILGMIFLDGIINSILLEGLMTFLGTEQISHLVIIKFNPFITLIDIVTVLVITLIAAMVPILSIHKIKPIKIIKSKE